MPAPIISWRLSDNSTPILADFGTIDAGSGSATPLQFYLWNGNATTTVLSDAQNCKITTKDNTTGDMVTDPVKNKWMSVKNLSASESTFTAVGSNYIAGTPPTVTEVAKTVFADDPSLPHQTTAPTSPADKSYWIDTTNSATTGNVMKQYDATGSGTWNVANTIFGKVNDGTIANSKANYVNVALRMDIPSSAAAGTFPFLIRLRYSFV